MEIQRLFAQRLNAEIPKPRETEPKYETLGIGEPVVPDGQDDDPGIDFLDVPKETPAVQPEGTPEANVGDKANESGNMRKLQGEKSPDAVLEKYKAMGFTDEIISEYFDFVKDGNEWYLDPKDSYDMTKDVKNMSPKGEALPLLPLEGLTVNEDYTPDPRDEVNIVTYVLTKKDGSGTVKITLPSGLNESTEASVAKYDENGHYINDPENPPYDVNVDNVPTDTPDVQPGDTPEANVGDKANESGNMRQLQGEKSPDAVLEKYKAMGFTDEIISEYFDFVNDHGQWYLDPADGYDMNKTTNTIVKSFSSINDDGTVEQHEKDVENITYTFTKKDGSGSVKIEMPSEVRTFTNPKITKYDKDGNVIDVPKDTSAVQPEDGTENPDPTEPEPNNDSSPKPLSAGFLSRFLAKFRSK